MNLFRGREGGELWSVKTGLAMRIWTLTTDQRGIESAMKRNVVRGDGQLLRQACACMLGSLKWEEEPAPIDIID